MDLDMSAARRHRMEAELRTLRRRYRFVRHQYRSTGKTFRDYLKEVYRLNAEGGVSPEMSAAQIGEIVAERLRQEIGAMKVDPRAIAKEVSKAVQAAPAPVAAAAAKPAEPAPIPVDDVQAMLDRILDRPM